MTPRAHENRKWAYKCRIDRIPKGIKIKCNYRDKLFKMNGMMIIGNMKTGEGVLEDNIAKLWWVTCLK